MNRGKWYYVASFDIANALDNVPHRQLLMALAAVGMDEHSRRLIHDRLRLRTFQGKLATSKGRCYSETYPITERLPQIGVLSPVLCLAFVSPIVRKLDEDDWRTWGKLDVEEN